MIKIVKLNETYIKLVCEPHILQELSQHFTFRVENYQYTPAGKKGWDGYKKLLSSKTGIIYGGLLKTVILKCKELGYHEFSFEGFPKDTIEYSEEEVLDNIESYNLPEDRQPREHQLNAILTCLMGNRRICLSATSSGKSLIQYIVSRMLIDSGKKILIIVPTVFLVDQMYSDFESYSIDGKFNIEENYHKIFSGQSKYSDNPCYISTYQSITKLNRENGEFQEYLSKFDVVLCDEVHGAEGKSITEIMEHCVNAKFRLGFTGTIKDTKLHKLQLVGLFGTIKDIISTKELIDKGFAAELKIKCIVLQYSDEMRRLVLGMEYQDELDTIIGYKPRNEFLSKLCDKLQGNTLTLIRYVEKHAKILKEYYDAKNNKKTYLLTGDTDKDEKMFVKEHLETVTNTNLMGSYGLLSTGTSIINLNNLIFASPSKSKIRVLQSIGRLLRKGKNKNKAVIYDIVDDLRIPDETPNYMMQHFFKRYSYYKNEGFDVEIISINIE